MPEGVSRRLYPVPDRRDPLDRSTHGLRQLLGWLGMLLPPLCVLWARIFPTVVEDASGRASPLELTSVSAYYYTSAVAPFVGILVGIGLFLFTYKGYADRAESSDFWVSTLAGVAAIGVAAFPTRPPDPSLQPSWWSSWMSGAHFASATTLFLLFVVFCWFLFPGKDWRLSEAALKQRNWKRLTLPKRVAKYPVYFGSGLVILVCLAWAAARLRFYEEASIFWQEWFALWAFGVAWLRAGQVQWTLRESLLTRPIAVGLERVGARLRGSSSPAERERPT